MASSSRDPYDTDTEYQKFLAEAKYAFCDIVRHKAERMQGQFDPSDLVRTPEEFKNLAGAVFDYLMPRASKQQPTRGTKNLRNAIGPLMRKYTTDENKKKTMEYHLYHFVLDYTYAGIPDPHILNYYGHVNRVLRWTKYDKRFEYLASMVPAIEFAAALQTSRGG